jgi:hypothetical protein
MGDFESCSSRKNLNKSVSKSHAWRLEGLYVIQSSLYRFKWETLKSGSSRKIPNL